jgi:hypothetical protein
MINGSTRPRKREKIKKSVNSVDRWKQIEDSIELDSSVLFG